MGAITPGKSGIISFLFKNFIIDSIALFTIILKSSILCELNILWISRSNSTQTHKAVTYRTIVNEDEVIMFLSKYMTNVTRVVIKKYDFAAIPFKEQLEIISKTDVMIAHHGAALTHILFLPPHAIVIEFNANVNKHFHNLCSLVGRAWTMLTVDGIFTDGSYNHLVNVKFTSQRILDLSIMVNRAIESIVKFLNKNNIMPEFPKVKAPLRDNIGDYQHLHEKISSLFIDHLYRNEGKKEKKDKKKNLYTTIFSNPKKPNATHPVVVVKKILKNLRKRNVELNN